MAQLTNLEGKLPCNSIFIFVTNSDAVTRQQSAASALTLLWTCQVHTEQNQQWILTVLLAGIMAVNFNNSLSVSWTRGSQENDNNPFNDPLSRVSRHQNNIHWLSLWLLYIF